MTEQITEKGIVKAMGILRRDGYSLPQSENVMVNAVHLRSSVSAYLEASKAKGDARTESEMLDAVLMVFFDMYLQTTLQNVN